MLFGSARVSARYAISGLIHYRATRHPQIPGWWE
jgi:hypothetical protein